MKFSPNKKYNTIAVYAIIVIAISMLMVIAIFKFSTISSIVSKVLGILSPVFWGLGIAFLLNPLMNVIEKTLKRYVIKKPHPTLLRAISVTLTCVFFVALLGGLLYIVIPAFADSMTNMGENITNMYNKLYDWTERVLSDNPNLESIVKEKIDDFTSNLNSLFDKVQPMLGDIVSGAWNFVNVLFDFVLGFIVSIYILVSKETLQAQFKKLFVATFKRSTCNEIFRITSMSCKTFGNFLTGKIIDSVIIGIMCFFGCWILDIPYYVLIAVIVGITNVIPYFGPFIGAIPSAALVLFVEPRKCIVFVIFIFILQQFDGNILGPKILGGVTGLPTFWVLVALFVGGGLFKVLGLLLAVPACSVAYELLKENTRKKLRRKNMPTETKDYISDISRLYPASDKKEGLTVEELESIIIPSADEVNEVKLDV
ncbi:MAG: AI-2E family transporter [Oscillospiraceae bacterium]|nr:AI-2E family transporter [Oscillospiraceae bacterium]